MAKKQGDGGLVSGPMAGWYPGAGGSKGGGHGGSGGGGNGGGGNPAAAKSATQLIKQTLASWGLSSLAKTALKFWKDGFGTDPQTLQLELENTHEWKVRFAGNEMRVKAGLTPLDPASYIGMEDSYRQIAKQFGLSSQYYGHNALAKLIGGDVSATEYQSRAQIALQTFTQAPDAYKAYWSKYGFTPGDAVSAIMDTTGTTLANLQLQANAVQIGGTAAQMGVDVGGKRALTLAENGVTLAQARQAYQQIADYGTSVSEMAKRYGQTFDQNDMENSLLLNQAAAVRKQNLIFGSEAANFAGHGGNTSGSASIEGNY